MSRETNSGRQTPQAETDWTTDDDGFELSRRATVLGMGGLLGASLVPMSAAAADYEPDVHTRQTHRAAVDAAIPRTPELGDVQVPGALDIELEQYVTFQLTFGETVPKKPRQRDGFADDWEVAYDAETGDLERYLAGVEQQAGFSIEEDLGLTRDAIFGALEGIAVEIEPSGRASLTVTAGGETTTTRREELPLAALFAATLDLYALFLLVGGGTRGRIRPRQQFRGGGLFTYLAPVDRMQCLLFVTSEDGQAIDAAGTAFLPDPAVAADAVSTTLVSTLVGYYSEWEAYGSTKTDAPNDRELQQPVETTQGFQQVGYEGRVDGRAGYEPGPIDGFAENDWGENA